MALYPQISLCVKRACDNLSFTELTGTYDAATNTGGYGGVNINTNDIATADLYITSPDSKVYIIHLKTLSSFPSTNTSFEYSIDISTLDSRTTIEDGYWQFTYKLLTNSSQLYTATKFYFFHCNSKCCIDKLISKIEIDECGCDEKNNANLGNLNRAKAFYQSLQSAASCGNVIKFNKIKSFLAKLCRNTGCKTC